MWGYEFIISHMLKKSGDEVASKLLTIPRFKSYLPKIPGLRPNLAANTSSFSFWGTLNLSSVAVRSFTET
jgi:hypothetical protein